MTALGLRRLIGGNWGEANTQQSTHNSPDCANLGKDFPQGRQNQSTLRRLKYENNSKKCWNIYSRLFEKAKSSKNHFLGNFSYLTAAPKKHLFCKVCARECFLAIMAWKIFFFKASCECGVVWELLKRQIWGRWLLRAGEKEAAVWEDWCDAEIFLQDTNFTERSKYYQKYLQTNDYIQEILQGYCILYSAFWQF